MKKCTVGDRHKWKWVRNETQVIVLTNSTRLSLKGFYTCECGEYKYGNSK